MRQKWCAAYFRSAAAPRQPRVPTGEALSAAIAALKAGDTAAAEKAVGGLNLDGLTSFERGMAEAVQFNIAYSQKNFSYAREHLQAAVDAEVVPPGVAAGIIQFMNHMEEMAARPRPPRLGDGDPRRPEESVVPAEGIEPPTP